MEYRVSEKGAVSIYWLNRFPVTWYADECRSVFRAARIVRCCIATHHPQLECRCSLESCELLRGALERGELGSELRLGEIWCRKSEKGAVSLYGVRRRFPITLYCSQWLRVLQAQPTINQFIDDNEHLLITKGCCVPKLREMSSLRPIHESIGADNIIRPGAARFHASW